VNEARRQQAGPATRTALGKRSLVSGIGDTPAEKPKDLEHNTARKRRKLSVITCEEPEAVAALALDELVDVAATGDTAAEILDAELGRAACLELLTMDEADIEFTEVSSCECAVVLTLCGCSCVPVSFEPCFWVLCARLSSGIKQERSLLGSSM
jgi:hypothetical protein